MINKLITTALLSLLSMGAANAAIDQTKGDFKDKFRQLDESLPTPNVYRNAAGQPGHQYWQQEVDYKIKVHLNEEKRRLEATESITYTNNSPDTLRYLWLQLDQNKFKNDSMSAMTTTFGGIGARGPATKGATSSKPAQVSLAALRRDQFVADHELGYDIQKVVDATGSKLHLSLIHI